MSSVLRADEGHTSHSRVASRSLSAPQKNLVAGRVAVAAPAHAQPCSPGPAQRQVPPSPVSPLAPCDHDTPAQPGETRDLREAAQRRLERRIRAHMSRGELSVTLTDNRYTMISVRREVKGKRRYKVRLHHMFDAASPVITRALARYIAHNDKDASRVLGEFIDANQHRVRARARKLATQRMITRGKIHDLQEIFHELNQRYFNGAIDARITWGQRTGKPRRRNSIKMGSYSVEDRLIRIHRSLDRSFVPRFFVAWVVYHEMLHQVHDIKVVNGRRQFHSREFLRDEAMFEHYEAARGWERAHLDALLTY